MHPSNWSKSLWALESASTRETRSSGTFPWRRRTGRMVRKKPFGESSGTWRRTWTLSAKYVNDLVNKASNNHLVMKDGHGYRVSPKGIGSFLLLSLATRKLLQELDSTNSRNKSFEE